MERVCYLTLGFSEIRKQLWSRYRLVNVSTMHNAKTNLWAWQVDFKQKGSRHKDAGHPVEAWQDTQAGHATEHSVFGQWMHEGTGGKIDLQVANWFCRVIDRNPWFDEAKVKGGCPEMAGLRHDDKIIITCHGNVDEDYCHVHTDRHDGGSKRNNWNMRYHIPLRKGVDRDIPGNKVKFSDLADLVANNLPSVKDLPVVHVTLSMCLMAMSSKYDVTKTFGYKFAKELARKASRPVEIRCRTTSLMTPSYSDMQEALGVSTAGNRINDELKTSHRKRLEAFIGAEIVNIDSYMSGMMNFVFRAEHRPGFLGGTQTVTVESTQDAKRKFDLQKDTTIIILHWCAQKTSIAVKREDTLATADFVKICDDRLEIISHLTAWIERKGSSIHKTSSTFGSSNNTLATVNSIVNDLKLDRVPQLPRALQNKYTDRNGQRWFEMRQSARICENLLYWLGAYDDSKIFEKPLAKEIAGIVNRVNLQNLRSEMIEVLTKWLADKNQCINQAEYKDLKSKVEKMKASVFLNEKVDAWF